jgi:hypothetical protein
MGLMDCASNLHRFVLSVGWFREITFAIPFLVSDCLSFEKACVMSLQFALRDSLALLVEYTDLTIAWPPSTTSTL